MTGKLVEIICSECSADTLILRSPKYDGFKKVGFSLKCSSCGHEYASEDDVPFKGAKKPAKIFDESDADAKIDVFKHDERGRLCRHCKHYVVNPFVQRCGLSVQLKLVEATDVCDEFERMPDPEPESEEQESDSESPTTE